MVAMREGGPQHTMLGVPGKTVNRSEAGRFESGTAPAGGWAPRVRIRSRHCPALGSVLKCSNARAWQTDDVRGAIRIAAADPFSGRVAASAGPGDAREARGPEPDRGSGARSAFAFARPNRGRTKFRSDWH